MFYIWLIIAGAAAGFAINRGTDRRFDDEVALAMGAGVVVVCYLVMLALPLLLAAVKSLLILLVIAGAAAALYLFVKKK